MRACEEITFWRAEFAVYFVGESEIYSSNHLCISNNNANVAEAPCCVCYSALLWHLQWFDGRWFDFDFYLWMDYGCADGRSRWWWTLSSDSGSHTIADYYLLSSVARGKAKAKAKATTKSWDVAAVWLKFQRILLLLLLGSKRCAGRTVHTAVVKRFSAFNEEK